MSDLATGWGKTGFIRVKLLWVEPGYTHGGWVRSVTRVFLGNTYQIRLCTVHPLDTQLGELSLGG
jgi:hypothetical protein